MQFLRYIRDLPGPDVLAQEIIDDLESALEQIKGVLNGLKGD